MRWTGVAILLAVTAACGRDQKAEPAGAARTPPPGAATQPAPQPRPATPPPLPVAVRPPPQLKLMLRSSPSGAQAFLDGEPVGETPMLLKVEADGEVHEFAFSLPGYEMARYRFPPVRDGTVFGTLRPTPAEP